jgi:hypothetical protein
MDARTHTFANGYTPCPSRRSSHGADFPQVLSEKFQSGLSCLRRGFRLLGETQNGDGETSDAGKTDVFPTGWALFGDGLRNSGTVPRAADLAGGRDPIRTAQ